MNGWLRPFGLTDKGKGMFIGGRAPAGWRGELARCTARLETLQRACAWVEKEARGQPKLRDEPLLGACLAALTGYEAADSDSLASETPRPQRPKPAKPEPRRKHDWDWPALGKVTEKQSPPLKPESPQPERSGSSQSKSQQAPPPLQLATKASRPLLSQLAGQKPRIEKVSRPQQRRPEVTSPARARIPPPAAGQEATGRQDWLHDLARRAKRTLHQKELEQGPRFSASSANQPRPGKAPSLVEQWKMPLKGQSAPADLLIRLVNASMSGPDKASGEGQAGVTHRQPSVAGASNQRPRPSSEAASPHGTKSWAEPLQPESKAESSGAMDESRPTTAAQTAAPPAGGDQAEGAGGEGEAPVRIAPPTEASTLPSLRPPGRASEPIAPLAAAIIRQGSRQAEVGTDEGDLTTLSAKIKRILDEEARRHGIDV